MKLSLIERVFLKYFIRLRCFSNLRHKIASGLILESDSTLDLLKNKHDKIDELETLIQALEQNSDSFNQQIQALTNCEWANVKDITTVLINTIAQTREEALLLERQAQGLRLIESALEH